MWKQCTLLVIVMIIGAQSATRLVIFGKDNEHDYANWLFTTETVNNAVLYEDMELNDNRIQGFIQQINDGDSLIIEMHGNLPNWQNVGSPVNTFITNVNGWVAGKQNLNKVLVSCNTDDRTPTQSWGKYPKKIVNFSPIGFINTPGGINLDGCYGSFDKDFTQDEDSFVEKVFSHFASAKKHGFLAPGIQITNSKIGSINFRLASHQGGASILSAAKKCKQNDLSEFTGNIKQAFGKDPAKLIKIYDLLTDVYKSDAQIKLWLNDVECYLTFMKAVDKHDSTNYHTYNRQIYGNTVGDRFNTQYLRLMGLQNTYSGFLELSSDFSQNNKLRSNE